MINVLVRLQLQDYSKWKPIFDEVATLRASLGSKGGRLFQSSDNPNHVAIIFDWDSTENAHKYFQSPELRQAMQRAGVQGPPDITYLSQTAVVSA